MRFQSRLTDAQEYVSFIREVKREPEAALRWFRGLVQATYSLENLPERCPIIPERAAFPFEIRHLIYHTHRIIFQVETSKHKVIIFRVYHGLRSALGMDELPQFG